MNKFNEFSVESATLTWPEKLHYALLHCPEIAPGEMFAQRQAYQEVILSRRPREALGGRIRAEEVVHRSDQLDRSDKSNDDSRAIKKAQRKW